MFIILISNYDLISKFILTDSTMITKKNKIENSKEKPNLDNIKKLLENQERVNKLFFCYSEEKE